MNSFEWIWQYAKKNKNKLLLAVIFVVINAILIVIIPLLSGRIVDQVINQGKIEELVPILGIMIGVTVIRTVVRYSYQVLFESVGQSALFDLRKDMYIKLQELDFDFFNHTRVGDIMARMTGDTDAIRHFVSWVTYNLLECILWFIAAVIVMGTINWQLMLALILITPLIFLLTQKMSKESHPVTQANALYNLLPSEEKENLINNIAASLGQVKNQEIIARQIDLFTRVNPEYGARVAQAIKQQA